MGKVREVIKKSEEKAKKANSFVKVFLDLRPRIKWFARKFGNWDEATNPNEEIPSILSDFAEWLINVLVNGFLINFVLHFSVSFKWNFATTFAWGVALWTLFKLYDYYILGQEKKNRAFPSMKVEVKK